MAKPRGRRTPEIRNRILAALPAEEMRRLESHLEPVALTYKLDLYRRDSPVRQVYFVNRGVASLTTPMDGGQPVEIATVGPEGMVGLPVFLAADRIAHRAFMQVPGEGVRLGTREFLSLIDSCPVLNRMLQRYTLALINQIGQNAACNRTHTVDERCARWLLMTHDRVDSDSFPLTQEFLAQMLGVRRPTVSIAAGMLQRAGLISYMRGQMTLLDRAGLERAACDCYRIISDSFDRMSREPARRRARPPNRRTAEA